MDSRLAVAFWAISICVLPRVVSGRSFTSRNASRLRGSHRTFTRYQQSSDLISAFDGLASSENCPGSVVRTRKEVDEFDHNSHVFVVSLGNPHAKRKTLVVAGEHGRELIAGEALLHFARDACSNGLGGANDVLFIMAPAVNDKGRDLVVSGASPCQRLTPENWDINRDGSVAWNKTQGVDNPLHTYQLRILDRIASVERPDAYVDLHSGPPQEGVPDRALAYPWGTSEVPNPDVGMQEALLAEVRQKHCPECAIGSCYKMNGYPQPGAVVDHMYWKQRIPLSFLWEIYAGPADGDCIDAFNPSDADFDATTAIWAGALKTVGEYIQNNQPMPAFSAMSSSSKLASVHGL